MKLDLLLKNILSPAATAAGNSRSLQPGISADNRSLYLSKLRSTGWHLLPLSVLPLQPMSKVKLRAKFRACQLSAKFKFSWCLVRTIKTSTSKIKRNRVILQGLFTVLGLGR